jgi:hypothetical protein
MALPLYKSKYKEHPEPFVKELFPDFNDEEVKYVVEKIKERFITLVYYERDFVSTLDAAIHNNRSTTNPYLRKVLHFFVKEFRKANVKSIRQYVDKSLEESLIKEDVENSNYVAYKGDVPNGIKFDDRPTFFTADKQSAEFYTQSRKEQGGNPNNITLKANLTLKNPLIINAERAGAQNLITPEGENLGVLGKGDWANAVQSKGYDSIVINRKFSTPLDGWEIVVFNGNQISPMDSLKYSK